MTGKSKYSRQRENKKNRGFFLSLALLLISGISFAQVAEPMYRIAKIKVDPAKLDMYTIALKEQMNTALQLEPGVLSYTALADKSNPNQITILEVCADTVAYQSHIQTPHFKKYKETVKNMVQSLELIDVQLIASARKKKDKGR
jgi:quinol monooxygenase YgiN